MSQQINLPSTSTSPPPYYRHPSHVEDIKRPLISNTSTHHHHHSNPPPERRLSPIYTLFSSSPTPRSPRLPPSPSFSSSPVLAPYLLELAMSDGRLLHSPASFTSRESSLPSLMSMPPTRPVSPGRSLNTPSSTTFAPSHLSPRLISNNNRSNDLTTSSSSSSNPTSPRISRRFNTRSSTRAFSNLCMFEDGLQHYERLRSPSLRGHSRRTSLIHSLTDNQSIIKDQSASGEMFEFDLSGDFEEETLRETRWSDAEDDDDEDEDEDEDEQFGHQFPSNRGSGTRKLFRVGDRVGVGTIHQGYRVRDLFDAAPVSSPRFSQSSIENYGGSGILEVVRQIGVGSYAVVFLVREVLYDPDLESESTPLDGASSQTPRASDGFASISAAEKLASTRRRGSSQVVYGKDFALKCLCKRNLPDELLVLQRGEAELHRSLPLHNNIVALHRALETPNWLFLVIEYCPGQDLFYWLEQARDSQDLESMSSRTTSRAPNLPGIIDTHLSPVKEDLGDDSLANMSTLSLNTPPSPSLLAITSDDEILSRRRLRLISKMFVQMCDAVEACHRAGVCHRDIKPENFIVVDDRNARSSDSWKVQSADSQSVPRSSVIVKITDWGLGTSSKACEDFDCGSKPYMAFECRNNLNPTYDPVQADVWSLGIVLLNLLYHRCPWADPSYSDPDFAEFIRGPVSFLRGRFEGMTESVASFLANKIFCEVGHKNQRRISAGHFGDWAQSLLQHMGGGQSHASVSNATIALSHSSTRSAADQRHSTRHSSLGRLSKASSQLSHSINSPGHVPEALASFIKLPETIKENVPKPPSFLNPIDFSPSTPKDLHPSLESPESIQGDIYKFDKISLDAWPINTLDVKVDSGPTEILADEVLSVQGKFGTTEAVGEDSESMHSSSKIGPDKPRRRKRGARKGRKIDSKQNGSTEPHPPSPASQKAEVDMLDGLAEASQSLAREISQATRTLKPSDEGTTTKRKMNIAERMMEKFRDGSNPDLQAFVARARAKEAAYMGKVKSNTASAPAQLQEINQTLGQDNVFLRSTAGSTSSFGIGSTISTHSSSNSTSWGNSSESSSSFSKPSSMTHWSSASHRRERIQKTFNPLPPSVVGSTTTSSLSTTALGSCKDSGSTLIQNKHDSMTKNVIQNHHPNKKEESKNKLAQLLTSFKRYNSTLGNHLSSSSAANSTPNSHHVSPSTIPPSSVGITSSAAAAVSISPFKVNNP